MILPFRVRAADTLLNEGIPELIATEFTGENGPRAVHMGTVLRAWRRAGGGLRRPLEQPEMMRLAREVDAGLLVDGSVVGLGSRITLSASVVAVSSGDIRRAGSVSGPADSLEPLVNRLTAAIMAASGTERGSGSQATLTGSPMAMRAYLEGLSLFRHGRFADAGGAFERAFGLDSSFARAAFMRYLATTWYDLPAWEQWAQAAFAGRSRLSAADRVLLDAFIGSRYPEPRTPQSELIERRRAVSLLPESPEAHYVLADYLFHNGAANDLVDGLDQARAAFERSLALDTQVTVLQHLLDIGLFAADSALLLRIWPVYDRLREDPSWTTTYGMVIVEVTGDAALTAAMARRVIPHDAWPWVLTAAAVPAAGVARYYERLAPALRGEPRQELELIRDVTLLWTGRPSTLVAERERVRDVARGSRTDRLLVLSWLFADGDSTAAAAAVARLRTTTLSDSAAQAESVCARALWQVRVGATPEYDAALLERHGRICAASIELWRAWRANVPDLDARLAATDSLLHWAMAEDPLALQGFAHLILARVWEARGNRARAFAAARLRPYGFGLQIDEATTAREEGRLAALVGDTTGAVRAYRRYVAFRRDAEPALVPQRDSVRAELARLGRR